MKRLALYLSIFTLLLGPIMIVTPVMALDVNLIANASVETADSTGAPLNWNQSKWGSNTATFQYKTPGHTGNRSLYTSMTARTDGDAKWTHDAVNVLPNTSYTYTSSYESNIATEIDLQYTDTAGNVSYAYVGSIPASASWQTLSVDFKTPVNVAKVSVLHIVAAIGWLQTDDFSLFKTVIAPPAAQSNYILNNSFETANGTVPASWYKNSWGTNTTQFSYENTGHTGTRSAKVTISAYTNGDAKWFAEPSVVVAGTDYLYQDYYKSTVPTRVVVAFIDANNNYSYYELAGASASGTSWTQYSAIFSAPSFAVKASVFHILDSKGSLTIDDTYLYPYALQPSSSIDPIIPNPSLEIANGAIPANWQKNNWGTNTASYKYVSEGHTGTKSVKVTVSKYTSGDAKWFFSPITTLQPGKQYRFTTWYKTNVTPRAVAMFNMNDGTTKYFGMPVSQPNGSTTLWQKYTDTFIVPVGTVSTSVFLFIDQNGWLQTDDYSLVNYSPAGFSRPLLSMTFDDGHEDNVTTALPILNQYGLKTTQCYASSYIEGMSQEIIDGILAFSKSGHEICSHTVTHPFLTLASSTNLTYELQHSKQYLESITGQSVVSFASPYGDYSTKVLNEIKKFYRLHRSVDEGFNSKDNLNAYNLRVQNILDTTTAEQVAAWIAQAKTDNTWLILVYHRVANDPGPYDSYIDVFKQHIQVIRDSAITVKTINDAFSEVAIQ